MSEDILKIISIVQIVEEGARHEELLAIYQTKTFEVFGLFQDCQHFCRLELKLCSV